MLKTYNYNSQHALTDPFLHLQLLQETLDLLGVVVFQQTRNQAAPLFSKHTIHLQGTGMMKHFHFLHFPILEQKKNKKKSHKSSDPEPNPPSIALIVSDLFIAIKAKRSVRHPQRDCGSLD